MPGTLQDVRFAVRTFRRRWAVTLVAIASLAVAIGGNTAVFGLINSLLFQPLTAREPDRLVVLQERQKDQPATPSTLATSLATWADLAERSRTTAGWAAYRPTVLGLRGPERSEPITGARITTNLFEVLGVQAGRGRVFRAEEGVEGAPRVALVTPEFWRRTHGDARALGQVLILDGEPYEVVGVIPDHFTFLFLNADIWVPLTDDPRESLRDRRDLISIARLAPGASMEQARAEMTALAGQLETEFPALQRDWTLDVFNARTDLPGNRSKIFYALLQGSVFFVLLIACANLTNLLLARGQERRREIALRSTLGAGRTRIVRQLLTESGILVVVGALAGLGLGWYGIRAMANRFASVLPAGYSPTLDARVVLFTVGISALAALLFGLVPATQTFRAGQSEVLKEGSGRSTAGRGRTLLTRGLVVAEVALSLLALGGGGMLVRSFLDLQNADPGFDGSAILTTTLRVPDSRYPTDEERLALLDRVLERARRLDGARAVAVVNVLPRNVQAPTDTFRVQGREIDPAASAPRAFAIQASPEYAEAFDIDVVQGRFFEEGDRPEQPPVVVVNRSFAEKWFEGESPVGHMLQFRGEPRQIVGVVGDVQQVFISTPGQVESEAIYMPAAQSPDDDYTLVVGAAGDPARMKEPLRTGLQELDPDLTLSQTLTMDEVTDRFFVGVNVFNTILGGFGVLAILLAALGTYSVLAYQVSQRRHEIGIRMAVGAQAGAVVRMVAKQGVAMSVLGLGIGGLIMIPLTRLVRTLLAGFTTVSVDTGFVVAGILFTVTLVASLVPAYRASATDPVRALRDE